MSTPGDGIPPLAPDDRPFDDDDFLQPITRTRWWRAATAIIILAILLGLAAPLFDW